MKIGCGVKFNALTLVRTSILVALVGLCTAAFSLPDAEASHFRGGHISWKPLTGTDIEFTITEAWRGTAFGSPPLGGIFFPDCIDYGDGFGDCPSFTVIALDPVNDWIVGQATTTHTYPSAGDFTAFTDSCCRIGGCDGINDHINNPSGGFRLETLVNVGTGNSSPVSSLPPIVVCIQGSLCTFIVPATDPDGNPLTFRFATSAESNLFSIPPGPPFATIDPITGLYTWDTTGATLACILGSNTLYSTQVMIEDGTSKVPMDFFIRLVDCPGGVPPVFDSPPTPACGSTLTASVGNLLTFTVQASDSNPGDTVTLNSAGLPLGATMTPSLPTSGNPVSSTFSWTPSPGQEGNHIVTFFATDDCGLQTLCSITIEVSECSCPDGPTGCISGTVTQIGIEGETLTGKTVRLYDSIRRIHLPSVTTDSQGCYRFNDLADSRYFVFMLGQCREVGGHHWVQVKVIKDGSKVNNVNFECSR